MITIKNLSFTYNQEIRVIDKLNLQLEKSYIHGIVGMNGSGKTSLLKLIFGLLKPQKGEIFYNEQRISKRNIAFLPSENFFYSNITAREYLLLFKNEKFNIERWNELFLLPLDDIIDTYSTGMKKKLAFLGVLKMNKPIMILDEPFNGLDLETSRILRSVLLKLKENGKLIVVTSHILETLINMSDYIHYLEDGKIKYSVEKADFEGFKEVLFKDIENKNESLIQGLTNEDSLQIED